jgi:hypothetical protein
MGIAKSSRLDHLNTAPNKMYTTLGTAFPDTAMALDSIYNRPLNARELEMRVQHAAQELTVACPGGRTPEGYRCWRDRHSLRALEVIRALFYGAAGTRTAQ